MPRIPASRPASPLMDTTFSALGWCHRAAKAVGSARFAETISRASFYARRAGQLAVTPGERAIQTGLLIALDELVIADAQGRAVLSQSVSGMSAAEATEFVEMIEDGDEFPYPAI